jgi:hypothetical protein
MHQHPRPSTRAAVPASVTHNTPSRQSNTRDIMADRTYSSEDLSSGSQTVRTFDGKEQSLRDKANLVVQHFFTKAALIICSSRVSLPPAMSKTGEAKIDRWVRNLSSTFHSCELAVHPLDHRSTLYCWRKTLESWLALCDLEPGGCITVRHSCVEEFLPSLPCVILVHAQPKTNLALPCHITMFHLRCIVIMSDPYPVQYLDRGDRHVEPRLARVEVHGRNRRKTCSIGNRCLPGYRPARPQPDSGRHRRTRQTMGCDRDFEKTRSTSTHPSKPHPLHFCIREMDNQPGRSFVSVSGYPQRARP